MKNIVSLCLVCFMVFSLAGCGKEKPQEYISKANVEILKQMVEVTDNYIDSEIEGQEARDKLERLEGRLQEGANDNEKIMIITASGLAAKISTGITKEQQAANDKALLQQRNKVAMPLGMDKKY